MTIPTYEELMLPILQVLSDGKQHQINELVTKLGKRFGLSDVELLETIPSGGKKFAGRVGWARAYLKGAKLIEFPKRANSLINDRGYKALKDNPANMSQYLKQYPEYLEFIGIKKKSNLEKEFLNIENTETPDEIIASAQQLYSDNLQNELLSKLNTVDPIRFEEIVLELMEKMNYGVGQMTKTSHDGGIDGIIDEDELGLEKNYLQVKRYATNKVNEKEVQNFAGGWGVQQLIRAFL